MPVDGCLVFMILITLAMLGGTGCRTAGGGRDLKTMEADKKKDSKPPVQHRKVHHNQPRVFPTTGQKLNPIFWWGNIDEPIPPDDYRPWDKNRVRRWYFRNPLHNFTFYVIGIADKNFVQTGRHPGEVFSPNQGWNWTVCRYKMVCLPFLSYQKGNFRFYFGWRERGNFGIKLTF